MQTQSKAKPYALAVMCLLSVGVQMHGQVVSPSSIELSISPAVEIGWRSVSNKLYQLEWTDQLTGSTNAWRTLGEPVSGNGGTNYVFDTTRVSQRRFYRASCVTNDSPTATQPSFAWGVCGHPFVQAAYKDIPTTNQLDLVAALGAVWYRVDAPVVSVTNAGVPWGQFLADAQARGIKILPILFPSLYVGDTGYSAQELEAEAFASGQALAQFFHGRVSVYEIHNELDLYSIISPNTPDGSQVTHYDDGRYQRALAQIRGLIAGVRSVDTTARTMVNAGGGYHYGFFRRLVTDGVRFDILGWHWYSEMGDMVCRGILTQLESFGRPIWLTEIDRRDGSADGNEPAQASYLADAATRYSARRSIEGLFAYELLDEPYFTGGEGAYGLVRVVSAAGHWQLGSSKPVFSELQGHIDVYRGVESSLIKAVQSAYRDLNGREAEPSGLAFWFGIAKQDGTDSMRSQIGEQREALELLVRVMYRQNWGVEPDPGGLAFWSGVGMANGRAAMRSALLTEIEHIRCP